MTNSATASHRDGWEIEQSKRKSSIAGGLGDLEIRGEQEKKDIAGGIGGTAFRLLLLLILWALSPAFVCSSRISDFPPINSGTLSIIQRELLGAEEWLQLEGEVGRPARQPNLGMGTRLWGHAPANHR